jgi:uncharacterized protein DUF4255
MSDALAIAAVTAVLKDLLHNGLAEKKVGDIIGDVTVSALPPDRVLPNGGEDPNQLNLFLYQVTPNAGWRNVGLPSRDAAGARTSNPPLALNLHFLLTAYGAKELFPEIILGHAMQRLHEFPVLSRDGIRKALTPPPLPAPPPFPPVLATSELANQVEQLKITPESLNTEEVSKLWSAFQTHYRPTAAYQVTVVLIESKSSTKAALQVQGRSVYVIPFEQPVVDKVTDAAGELLPILPTSTLRISGQKLRGNPTQVWVGASDLSAGITSISDREIQLALPAPLPAGLYAGIAPVRVVHPIAMGTPPVPHEGQESNVHPLVLRPIIGPVVVNAVGGVVNGVAVKSGKIRMTFNPRVHSDQRVALFLNEFQPLSDRPARAYSFRASAGNGVVPPAVDTDTIEFDYVNVIPGDYLVRAKVDGGESVLSFDNAGQFAQPRVTI